LNLELDDELMREGLAREVVRAIQNARKEAGLNVEDRIRLDLSGSGPLVSAIEAHHDFIAGEVLASELTLNGAGAGTVVEVKGHELRIALVRA
jgi:isoleucyl-tRNA synthetase